MTKRRKRYRYIVETGKSHLAVYEGDNQERAVEACNFWDERMDTWFIDTRKIPGYWLALDFEDGLLSVADAMDDAFYQAEAALSRAALHLTRRSSLR